jgi:hypothetical protein
MSQWKKLHEIIYDQWRLEGPHEMTDCSKTWSESGKLVEKFLTSWLKHMATDSIVDFWHMHCLKQLG